MRPPLVDEPYSMRRFISLAILVALAGAAGGRRAHRRWLLRIATPGNDGTGPRLRVDLGLSRRPDRGQIRDAPAADRVSPARWRRCGRIGETDITVTPARSTGSAHAARASFTHRSAVAITAVIVGKDSPIRLASELSGKIIGVPAERTGECTTRAASRTASTFDRKFVEVPGNDGRRSHARHGRAPPTNRAHRDDDEVRVLGTGMMPGNGIQVTAWCATEDRARTRSRTPICRRDPRSCRVGKTSGNHPASGAIQLDTCLGRAAPQDAPRDLRRSSTLR